MSQGEDGGLLRELDAADHQALEAGGMAYKQSIHIEAPVEKVFDFVSDPHNWREARAEGVEFTDVRLTEEGWGTNYGWTGRLAGLTIEGFGVFTEFIPNQRITDRSSSALEGTWTYSFHHFVTVPEDESAVLHTASALVTHGWGMIPLEARIGATP